MLEVNFPTNVFYSIFGKIPWAFPVWKIKIQIPCFPCAVYRGHLELIPRGQPWIHDSVTARSTALAFYVDNDTYKDLIFFLDVAGKRMSMSG